MFHCRLRILPCAINNSFVCVLPLTFLQSLQPSLYDCTGIKNRMHHCYVNWKATVSVKANRSHKWELQHLVWVNVKMQCNSNTRGEVKNGLSQIRPSSNKTEQWCSLFHIRETLFFPNVHWFAFVLWSLSHCPCQSPTHHPAALQPQLPLNLQRSLPQTTAIKAPGPAHCPLLPGPAHLDWQTAGSRSLKRGHPWKWWFRKWSHRGAGRQEETRPYSAAVYSSQT